VLLFLSLPYFAVTAIASATMLLPSPHVTVTIAASLPVYCCFLKSHGAVAVAVSASANAGPQMFLLTVSMPLVDDF